MKKATFRVEQLIFIPIFVANLNSDEEKDYFDTSIGHLYDFQRIGSTSYHHSTFGYH